MNPVVMQESGEHITDSEEKRRTLLDLVDACDSFPYNFPATVSPLTRLSRFYVKGELVGYLRSPVVEALRTDFPAYFDILPNEGSAYDVFVREKQQAQRGTSGGGSGVGGSSSTEEVTKLLNGVAQFWRSRDAFQVLFGWRDEQYTIYAKDGSCLFMLERAACGLFGVVTYGAHLNVFIPHPTDPRLTRMWCPRRSMSKATFPGKLDNSVAGGISNGLSAYETIIKEADEEASIPEEVARELVCSVGAISYIYVDGRVEDGEGWIQPEVQYLYDLPLTGRHEGLTLKPNDGEAEQFELWTMDKVKEEMLAGNFKPNCAAVLIDFMIRQGIITATNEPDFLRLQQRLHRTFEFPVQ